MGHDPGPPDAFAALFARVPDLSPVREHFWFDWGPVFYRGRLDGTARVLCVASDPGATERIAHRTLVGDAGQRVQGFLAKIGLTRSYVCLNAFPHALIPEHGDEAQPVLRRPDLVAWRNELFDMVRPSLEAVVAFGRNAQRAVNLWPARDGVPVHDVRHPTSREQDILLEEWRDAVTALRGEVTPDPDAQTALPNYGQSFREKDYAPIPREDLPFGVPWFLGDDAPGRAQTPPRRSGVTRPSPDDRHTLVWVAPRS